MFNPSQLVILKKTSPTTLVDDLLHLPEKDRLDYLKSQDSNFVMQFCIENSDNGTIIKIVTALPKCTETIDTLFDLITTSDACINNDIVATYILFVLCQHNDDTKAVLVKFSTLKECKNTALIASKLEKLPPDQCQEICQKSLFRDWFNTLFTNIPGENRLLFLQSLDKEFINKIFEPNYLIQEIIDLLPKNIETVRLLLAIFNREDCQLKIFETIIHYNDRERMSSFLAAFGIKETFIIRIIKLELDLILFDDMRQECIGIVFDWLGRDSIMQYINMESLLQQLSDQQVMTLLNCIGKDLLASRITPWIPILKNHNIKYFLRLIDIMEKFLGKEFAVKQIELVPNEELFWALFNAKTSQCKTLFEKFGVEFFKEKFRPNLQSDFEALLTRTFREPIPDTAKFTTKTLVGATRPKELQESIDTKLYGKWLLPPTQCAYSHFFGYINENGPTYWIPIQPHLERWISEGKSPAILDIGSANGCSLTEISETYNGKVGKLIGICLEEYKCKCPEVNTLLANAENIDKIAELPPVDAIISAWCFCHLQDPVGTLCLAYNTKLKLGGVLSIDFLPIPGCNKSEVEKIIQQLREQGFPLKEATVGFDECTEKYKIINIIIEKTSDNPLVFPLVYDAMKSGCVSYKFTPLSDPNLDAGDLQVLIADYKITLK